MTVSLLCLAACQEPSKDDGKGVVDDSQPPSIPTESGKADGASKIVTVDVQSAHPYANNFDRRFAVPTSALPSCAQRARLHFKVLRTEANYDYVVVEPAGQPSQSFDGTKDNTWTNWFDLTGVVNVRLDTDSSITRHGFEIDQIEWEGLPMGCPLVRFPPCGTGTVDLAATPGVCDCAAVPQCEAVEQLEVTHQVSRGRNQHTYHVAPNLVGEETRPDVADRLVTHALGTVDGERLATIVRTAASTGLLASAGYNHPLQPDGFSETIRFKAGAFDVTFVAAPDTHDAAITALAAQIDALFTCGAGESLTCGGGYTCNTESACEETASCVCPAIYQPVCGENGHTYSNACAAGCATAPVAHTGECGIAGDSCGTIFGLGCQDGFKCRYDVSTWNAPFPDAGGACVTNNFCDAASDCSGPHPAVLGSWACETNACAWKAGPQWKAFAAGRFETAHPYANSTSVWKEVALPTGAQALRLVVTSFELERDYDFLEVWSWVNGAWKLDRRYTGTTPPSSTEEFAGRYHYLRFASDSSVTKAGFALSTEWR